MSFCKTAYIAGISTLALSAVGLLLSFSSRLDYKGSKAAKRGIRTTGRVIAVKKQTPFHFENGLVDIRIQLLYVEPHTGELVLEELRIAQDTKNIPYAISGPGAGLVNFKAKLAALRAMRRQLPAPTMTSTQLDEYFMARVLEELMEEHSLVDEAGYLKFKEPLSVKVYVKDDPAEPPLVVFPRRK